MKDLVEEGRCLFGEFYGRDRECSSRNRSGRRKASIWDRVLGTLSSTGNVKRAVECASRVQVRVQAGFIDLVVSKRTDDLQNHELECSHQENNFRDQRQNSGAL